MKAESLITLHISDEDQGMAQHSVRLAEDMIRSLDGVVNVERRKQDGRSMDLGSVIELVATSGATLALAQGLSAWLKARRGAKVTIERDGSGESIKTLVEGIDPATAERIIERHTPQKA